jgi:hypothetical protein
MFIWEPMMAMATVMPSAVRIAAARPMICQTVSRWRCWVGDVDGSGLTAAVGSVRVYIPYCYRKTYALMYHERLPSQFCRLMPTYPKKLFKNNAQALLGPSFAWHKLCS